jgi:hypothetical protein
MGRQSGLMEQAYEIDAGERRHRRRLDDHRAAYGNRWRDLMDDQIEGMVERRDRGNDADRLDDREGPPVDACGRQPHRDFPATHDTQLFGCIAHPVDGAVGFDQRIRQWLAALSRDLAAEMVAHAFHQRRRVPEDLDPMMRFQPRTPVGEEPPGGLDLAVERRRVVAVEPSNRRPFKRLDDLDHDCSPFSLHGRVTRRPGPECSPNNRSARKAERSDMRVIESAP